MPPRRRRPLAVALPAGTSARVERLGVTARALQMRRPAEAARSADRELSAPTPTGSAADGTAPECAGRRGPGRGLPRPRATSRRKFPASTCARRPAGVRAVAPSRARAWVQPGPSEPKRTLSGPARRNASSSRSNRRTADVSAYTFGWRTRWSISACWARQSSEKRAEVRDHPRHGRVLAREELDDRDSPHVVEDGQRRTRFATSQTSRVIRVRHAGVP